VEGKQIFALLQERIDHSAAAAAEEERKLFRGRSRISEGDDRKNPVSAKKRTFLGIRLDSVSESSDSLSLIRELSSGEDKSHLSR
jgi:hypothetical protein